MANKSIEELELENALLKVTKDEREISDKRYAEMRVQIIVYSACALILIAVISTVVALVVQK
jgi:cell division septal protein FtsQ